MKKYDVIVVGGGLAGLVNAIQLTKAGISVSVFEKNEYPFHRVCGEYISNETLPFLQSMGLNPFDLGAVALHKFRLTSPKGNVLEMPLDLGGFGISRFTLDEALYHLALENGVEFHQQTQVSEIQKQDNHFLIQTEQKGDFEAAVVVGAYGKRSNLDKALNRSFFYRRSPYLGVKYHIKTDLQTDEWIALHNFKNGYCGISRIEEDKFCLCYLTTRQNLKDYQTIENLEDKILKQNKFLKAIWENAEFVFDKPKVINEVSFAPKPLIENGILMCGDTAGMIAPLCGNGMAMAIHSGKILSDLLIQFFNKQINQATLHQQYQAKWKKQFASRLWLGRNVQKFFGSPLLSELLVQTAKTIKPIGKILVKQSHGKVF